MAVNVEKFKKRILAEKLRLEGSRSRLTDNNGNSLNESSGEPADLDLSNPGDAGTDLVDRETEEALSENVEGMLAVISDALIKIDEGTYGVCSRCGKSISEARLEALPYAVYCIDCQSRMEGQ